MVEESKQDLREEDEERNSSSKLLSSTSRMSSVLSRMESSASSNANSSVAPATTVSLSTPPAFHVICAGQIESADFFGVDNVYCRYTVTMGPDWEVRQGVDSGLSQIGYKRPGGCNNNNNDIVLNFPIDLTLKSTNPFGWPRIVLSVYGVDAFGRDVIRGYGSVHIPTYAGSYVRKVPLFAPKASSTIQSIYQTLTGTRAEFYDSKIVAQSEGRDVTRVSSCGSLRLKFNITTHGMKSHGYSKTTQNILY